MLLVGLWVDSKNCQELPGFGHFEGQVELIEKRLIPFFDPLGITRVNQ